MPDRTLVTKELAALLGTLAHPVRIRIVEELREDEKDVNSLHDILGISQSGVSQHLSVLRARRIVTERREGRHVFYRLVQPALAKWLVEGLTLLQNTQNIVRDLSEAIEDVKAMWTSEV
ncbi:MAG: ArsR/SmtB family transcription factor [Gemmataceae bacterium]